MIINLFSAIVYMKSFSLVLKHITLTHRWILKKLLVYIMYGFNFKGRISLKFLWDFKYIYVNMQNISYIL